MWIYSPPVGKEKAGRVISVSTPIDHGMAEANVRRAALAGSGKSCPSQH